MKNLPFCIFSVVLFLLHSAAYAQTSVVKGELFGYKLGEQYPITKNTIRRSNSGSGLEFVAENPIKPDEIDVVGLVMHKDTLIITNIYGEKRFSDKPSAEYFVKKYTDLLTSAYPQGKNRQTDAERDAENRVLSAIHMNNPTFMDKIIGDFQLRINMYGPDTNGTNKFTVHIDLSTSPDSALKKKIGTQLKFDSENHLKAAEARGELKGMK